MATPSLGVHSLIKVDFNSGPSSATTPAVTTQASGSAIFLTYALGDNTYFDLARISDSKSNSPYAWIGAMQTYPSFPTSGQRQAVFYNAAGGANHTATVTFLLNDEITLSFVEIIGATGTQDHQVTTRTASTSIASPTATATGPGVAIAVIYGESFESSLAASNGFTIIEHYQGSGNSIQCGVAAKAITGAGSVSTTWTISDAQAAIVTMTIFGGAPDIIACPWIRA
jgi:hypothetical protein